MNDEQTLDNGGQLPEWVGEWKSKDEARLLREEAKHQVDFAGNLRIQYEGPQIVSDLVSELAVNIEAAKQLGFAGSATRKAQTESDHVAHVEVILCGPFPRKTHTNIFYKNGDNEIGFHTLEGEAFKLVFMVRENVRLRKENSADPMDAKQAAEWLVKQMCVRLKR
jgi:hypothetical protein